jgi:hypothetical protein
MLINRDALFVQPGSIYEKDDDPSTHLFAKHLDKGMRVR